MSCRVGQGSWGSQHVSPNAPIMQHHCSHGWVQAAEPGLAVVGSPGPPARPPAQCRYSLLPLLIPSRTWVGQKGSIGSTDKGYEDGGRLENKRMCLCTCSLLPVQFLVGVGRVLSHTLCSTSERVGWHVLWVGGRRIPSSSGHIGLLSAPPPPPPSRRAEGEKHSVLFSTSSPTHLERREE